MNVFGSTELFRWARHTCQCLSTLMMEGLNHWVQDSARIGCEIRTFI